MWWRHFIPFLIVQWDVVLIDFAVVVKDGKEQTIFLEMNDGYALGNYGLNVLHYAKLISARWAQILTREDVFDFRVKF